MNQHTPGPWKVRKDYAGAMAVVSETRFVARVGPLNIDHAEANARLIAAAPELLSAADQVANGSHLDDIPNHDDNSLRMIASRIADPWAKRALLAHADRIDAAIAKATGN